MLSQTRGLRLSAQFQRVLKSLKSKDFKLFSQLLTEIERLGPACLQAPELLNTPEKVPLRIGITGPPGSGKSTLISCLIKNFRAKGLTVGVLAVDPSSPFTQGAVLGDRIRYNDFHADSGVFIRSIGTRGSLGGLCGAAFLMLRAFDAFGFDVVLVETVGVGQTELEVVNVADTVAVVLVPESGDAIQAMKAGLLEIADLFIINKSDRPGGDSFAKEILAAFSTEGDTKTVPVFKTVAIEGRGVESVAQALLENLGDRNRKKKRSSPERLRAEAKALLRLKWESQISQKVASLKTSKGLRDLVALK